jgi:hypothetical protein
MSAGPGSDHESWSAKLVEVVHADIPALILSPVVFAPANRNCLPFDEVGFVQVKAVPE